MHSYTFKNTLKSSLALVLFANIGCKSIKLDKLAPVTIEKAFYKEQIIGTTLTIHLKDVSEIQLDSCYFRGRVAKLQPQGGKTYIGNFNNLPQDIIMDSNTNKEFVNQMDTKAIFKTPFELKDDECVIRYNRQEKAHYFKIEKLQKQE